MLAIDPDQMKRLKSAAVGRSGPQHMVMRANIVLLRGQGFSQLEVAARLQVERVVVSECGSRFCKEGIAGRFARGQAIIIDKRDFSRW